MKNFILSLLICVMCSACGIFSDDDRDRLIEAVEPCVGLSGEELEDCLIVGAREIAEEELRDLTGED